MMQSKNQIIKSKLETIILQIQTFCEKAKQQEIGVEWLPILLDQIDSTHQKMQKQTFQVAVMALMKSGKSTLINAWIGNEYLPSANSAETVQVLRISHCIDQREGQLLDKNGSLKAEGSLAVRKELRSINQYGRDNTEFYDEELSLLVNIDALKGKLDTTVRFTILDTPGGNEGLPIIEENIKILINKVDVVIYVMDYTKLDFENSEDADIITSLTDLRNNLITDQTRLFFVINKIDEINYNDKERGISNINDIEKLVRSKYLQKEGFGDHAVIPVSAKRALLARLMQSDNVTEEQKKEFYKQAFGDEYETTLDIFEGVFPSDFLKRAINNQIEKSNFNQLESEILDVLVKKGDTILLKAVKEDILRCLEQVSNKLQLEKASLETTQADIELLITKIDGILKKLNAVDVNNGAFVAFKKKINDKVKYSFQDFNQIITNHITNLFNSSDYGQNRYFNFLKQQFSFFFQTNHDIMIFANQQEQQQQLIALSNEMGRVLKLEFDRYWSPIIKQVYTWYVETAKDMEDKIKPAIRT